jgi:hypothetical protein
MTVVLGAESNTLRLDLEPVAAEQFPQGNVAYVISEAPVRLVICRPLAFVHGRKYEP